MTAMLAFIKKTASLTRCAARYWSADNVPARRLPWKIAVIGGLLTAILFDIGRWAIGLYLAHSTQPTAFGAAATRG
jgi:uncharacterized BrkB/YihY/UPF0761 family membrane protein